MNTLRYDFASVLPHANQPAQPKTPDIKTIVSSLKKDKSAPLYLHDNASLMVLVKAMGDYEKLQVDYQETINTKFKVTLVVSDTFQLEKSQLHTILLKMIDNTSRDFFRGFSAENIYVSYVQSVKKIDDFTFVVTFQACEYNPSENTWMDLWKTTVKSVNARFDVVKVSKRHLDTPMLRTDVIAEIDIYPQKAYISNFLYLVDEETTSKSNHIRHLLKDYASSYNRTVAGIVMDILILCTITLHAQFFDNPHSYIYLYDNWKSASNVTSKSILNYDKMVKKATTQEEITELQKVKTYIEQYTQKYGRSPRGGFYGGWNFVREHASNKYVLVNPVFQYTPTRQEL